MADPTTTSRNYAVPVHGSDVDTWDAPLNSNFGLIDKNLGATTTVALSNANVTLNATQLSCGVIRFTGILTAPVFVIFPSTVSGWWTIDNRTTGNFDVVVTTGGPGPEDIAIPQGQGMAVDIYVDAGSGGRVFFRNLYPAIGMYVDYAGTALPRWVTLCTVPPFLLCDGSAFNGTSYPTLAQILGGTTLPDFRGRSRSYLNGGTNRITAAVSGIDGDTRFSAGGSQSITIGQANLPAVAPSFTGVPISLGALSLNQPVPTPSAITAQPATSGLFGVNASFKPTVTIPPFTPSGDISNLGAGTPLASLPPTCIGGITMIRAG